MVAIVTVGLLLYLPKRQTETSWRKKHRRIDFLGVLLLVLAISSVLFGLDRGSNISWRQSLTIGYLCATVTLLIAFLAVETRFAVEPFTPGYAIFDRALFSCYSQNSFGYAAFTALSIYLPLYFQVVLGMMPIQAGASLVPAAISAVVGIRFRGMIIKRTGRLYWLAALAATVATLNTIPFVVAPSLNGGSLPTIFV
jgi:hypothetical protein